MIEEETGEVGLSPGLGYGDEVQEYGGGLSGTSLARDKSALW